MTPDSGLHRSVGSSPLARGLRKGPLRPSEGHRIIPARAGFTPYPHDLRHISVDHPRSRGVYASRRAPLSRKAGSSPLARGLLRRGPGRRRRRTDHPRSRGVYGFQAFALVVLVGSSPLARGLLPGGAQELLQGGIIPARAGFTSPRCCRGCWPGDHPRSRGVYSPFHRFLSIVVGSSPLARGLLTMRSGDRYVEGIIPARAGFTHLGMAALRAIKDHPRSRGVYRAPRATEPQRPGSSPLARGLRQSQFR